MFRDLEYMFHDLKHMFYALEYMFQARNINLQLLQNIFQTADGNLTITIGFCVAGSYQIGVEGLTFLLSDNLLPGSPMIAVIGCSQETNLLFD